MGLQNGSSLVVSSSILRGIFFWATNKKCGLIEGHYIFFPSDQKLEGNMSMHHQYHQLSVVLRWFSRMDVFDGFRGNKSDQHCSSILSSTSGRWTKFQWFLNMKVELDLDPLLKTFSSEGHEIHVNCPGSTSAWYPGLRMRRAFGEALRSFRPVSASRARREAPCCGLHQLPDAGRTLAALLFAQWRQ